MTARQRSADIIVDGQTRMRWAREMMDSIGVSQKDIARAWEVSESSVSRWLDGLQASDITLARAVTFSRLVQRSLEEIAGRLGNKVWRADGSEPTQALHPVAGPPIPTTSLRPGDRPGRFYLLLHLDLTAKNVAAIIATLEDEGAREIAEARRDTVLARETISTNLADLPRRAR
jgi:hypothetical protein